MKIQYLEIVSKDAKAQSAILKKLHGVNFDEPVAELGVAKRRPFTRMRCRLI